MRKVKQRISLLLVFVLLANLLLPGMGAFAAESTNDFLVPGSDEQILISPGEFNWGNQIVIPQTIENTTIETNTTTDEAIASEILEDREGQALPLLASITIRFAVQYVVRTLTVSRVAITAHASTRIVQRGYSSLQIQRAIDNGTKMIDKRTGARAIYDNSQDIMIILPYQNGRYVMHTVYKPETFSYVYNNFVISNWSW